MTQPVNNSPENEQVEGDVLKRPVTTKAQYARRVGTILRRVSAEVDNLSEGMWNPAFCSSDSRGYAEAFARDLKALSEGILSAQPEPSVTEGVGEHVGAIEVLDSLLRSGGETWLTREQEWALKSAIKVLAALASPKPAGEAVPVAELLEYRDDRDTAQSAVEAWAGVVESLEAHLQDRVAMKDEANPEAYLRILQGSVAQVQRDSKQIRASRWAERQRLVDQCAALEARAIAAEGERERFRKAAREAHDTLIELNPSNYTHDDVCEANGASVEAILILGEQLDESHGKSHQWWADRRAARQALAALKQDGGA